MNSENIIDDKDLEEIVGAAEKEIPNGTYYYLAGHAARGNDGVIDDYLSRHAPLSPEIASAVADALYDECGARENLDKWKECMLISTCAKSVDIGGNACFQLGLHFYKIFIGGQGGSSEALELALRGADVYNHPEAALMAGSIFEHSQTGPHFIKAAEYFLKAAKWIKTTDLLGFSYFDEGGIPVDENGKWTDYDLLANWMNLMTDGDKKELLKLIS